MLSCRTCGLPCLLRGAFILTRTGRTRSQGEVGRPFVSTSGRSGLCCGMVYDLVRFSLLRSSKFFSVWTIPMNPGRRLSAAKAIDPHFGETCAAPYRDKPPAMPDCTRFLVTVPESCCAPNPSYGRGSSRTASRTTSRTVSPRYSRYSRSDQEILPPPDTVK